MKMPHCEIPATAFEAVARPRRLVRFVDPSNRTLDEARRVFDQVATMGIATLVLVTHSFQYISPGHVPGERVAPAPHVVERVEVREHVTGSKFVTLYKYHHGYFDGGEREFRGFGLVEQWDTESFPQFTGAGLYPSALVVEDEDEAQIEEEDVLQVAPAPSPPAFETTVPQVVQTAAMLAFRRDGRLALEHEGTLQIWDAGQGTFGCSGLRENARRDESVCRRGTDSAVLLGNYGGWFRRSRHGPRIQVMRDVPRPKAGNDTDRMKIAAWAWWHSRCPDV